MHLSLKIESIQKTDFIYHLSFPFLNALFFISIVTVEYYFNVKTLKRT